MNTKFSKEQLEKIQAQYAKLNEEDRFNQNSPVWQAYLRLLPPEPGAFYHDGKSARVEKNLQLLNQVGSTKTNETILTKKQRLRGPGRYSNKED